MKLNRDDVIKFAGVAGTLLSIGATILTSYSSKKEQEVMIDKKVNDAINSYINSLTESK